jgi:microcystin-dependent protein
MYFNLFTIITFSIFIYLPAFLFAQPMRNAPVNVDEMLRRETSNMIAKRLPNIYPRGIVVMIASRQIDRWFTGDGAGIGEYKYWYICDGRNGTPDLRGRFIVGRDTRANSDYLEVGRTGGLNQVQLSESQLPRHTHRDSGHTHGININTNAGGDHTHPYKDVYYSEGIEGQKDYVSVPRNWGSNDSDYDNVGHQLSRNTSSAGSHTHSVVGQTSAASNTIGFAGENAPHENRPPYFVAVYIVYLGTETTDNSFHINY